MNPTFSNIDLLIIFIYLITALGIGLYASRRSDRNTEEYFLGGRNFGWFAVGLTIFATNISSEHFIGLAGSGATRGLAVGQFELMAIFVLILLGWVLTPIYLKSSVMTMPEFLEKRFDHKIRKVFTVLSICIYLFTKISVTLVAGGILFYKIFGLNIYASAIVIVLITGLYSLIGGSKAVIRTNVFQSFVLITGALLLTIFGLIEVGGFSGLNQKLSADFFSMFKPLSDPDFPWTGILFGAPIIAFWYWCTDQYIIQRLLSAKSLNDARRGSLLAAGLKILPIFILVLPGLIAAALYPEVSGDDAYPTLLASTLLPIGLKGLVLAGLLAAIMSSLSSVFNIIATLYTNDLYKPKHPSATESELVLVGRISTTLIIFTAILCVPLVRQFDSQIYIYLQSIQAYLGPPIAAVFIFGLSMKMVNAKGALLGLVIGEFVGLTRIITDLLAKENLLNNSILYYFNSINFLHFAIISFLISSFSIIAISYVTGRKKKIDDSIIGSTDLPGLWNLNFDFGNVKTIRATKVNIVLSTFIVIIIFGLWSIWS
ncbi:MAG: sodium:solute symporter [Ignavibacteriaceae bacterium]